MLVYLLKRKRFVISALFLVTLFFASILNTVLNDGQIRQVRFHSDEKGNIIDRPPYPPMTQYLFGSDRFGYDLGHLMVEGAKWTIGITIIIVFLRMLLSIVLASFIFPLKKRLFNWIKTIFEPFSVVPQTIIAYFILFSVLWMPLDGFHTPFWLRASFQVFILVVIAIPSLTVHISGEMRQVEKEDFIEVSKTLGSSKPYIFFKHIIPHVYEKWIILFGQQFIQTLQLLAHLGFMKLFFGGTHYPDDDTPPRTISFEWSGVIGGDISYLYSREPWIVLVPISFFIVTAICIALINQSVQAYFQSRKVIRLKKEP